MTDLSNQTIIVTGSSSGIGWEIAQQAHAAGANVLLHGSRVELLEKNAAELGDRSDFIAADLADAESPFEIVKKCVEAFGTVTGLVNNAGVFPRDNIETVSAQIFDRMMAINARAPMLMIQACMPHFKKQGTGSVVNIGSINAYCGQTDILAYSMSKGALMTMTRNLGDALGPENIRVNQLNVGWTYTETEHQTQLKEGRPEDWLSKLPKAFAPSGSILRPEHIAPHALFWLSPASWPVNGQVYEVEQYPMIGRSKINDN